MVRKDLTKTINSYLRDIDLYRSDFKYTKNMKTIEEVFQYYKEYQGFEVYNKKNKNSRIVFEELDEYMGWRDFYNQQVNFFEGLNDEDKEFYLEKFSKKFNLHYTKGDSLEASFGYVNNFIDIYREAKKYLKLIRENVERVIKEKFKGLEDLQKIILDYELRTKEKLPDKIRKCREIIKEELFVNIYDFAENNKIKFDSLDELAIYTEENNLYYPKDKAKKTFAYKVLLKYLF